MAIELPEQMLVLAITETAGMEMVSELVLLQPVDRFCVVRVYIVVTVGLTVGFEELDVKLPGVLDHE